MSDRDPQPHPCPECDGHPDEHDCETCGGDGWVER